MKKKLIIVFTIILSLQFIASCCPNPGTFEVTYSEISLHTLQLENNVLVKTQNNVKVNKLDFALGVSMQENLKQVASNFLEIGNLGFQKGYATSCPDNEFMYIENISAIKINQINASNTKVDVTQNFKYKDFNNQFLSISDFITKRETWQDDFNFYLKNESAIESSAKFEIIITFTTNKELSFITEDVLFN